jgi:hypothetical protein
MFYISINLHTLASLLFFYQLNNFILLLNKSVEPNPDNFPHLNPIILKDPAKATLFCNIVFKYPERNAMDVFLSVGTAMVISRLLDWCLPGTSAPPTRWPSGVRFNPNDKRRHQAELVKLQLVHKLEKGKHPLWDPAFEYSLSSVNVYLETYRRRAIRVASGQSLAQIFQTVVQSSPDKLEGICLEQGSIIFSVFRSGSKVEKHWLAGKGRKGFALAHPSE